MSSPINNERPFLDKIIDLQKLTSDLDLALHKQISGEIINNNAAMALIDSILLEVEILIDEHLLDNIDQQHLLDFAKEIKRLEIVLIYYKKNRIYDSASSSTEELFEIIDESLNAINKDLHSIIGIIRRQLSKSDETVLAGTRFIQKGLAYFLSLIIISTIIILFFFNETLSSNLKN